LLATKQCWVAEKHKFRLDEHGGVDVGGYRQGYVILASITYLGTYVPRYVTSI